MNRTLRIGCAALLALALLGCVPMPQEQDAAAIDDLAAEAFAAQEYELAADLFLQMIEMYPDREEAYENLARSYLALNQEDKARLALELGVLLTGSARLGGELAANTTPVAVHSVTVPVDAVCARLGNALFLGEILGLGVEAGGVLELPENLPEDTAVVFSASTSKLPEARIAAVHTGAHAVMSDAVVITLDLSALSGRAAPYEIDLLFRGDEGDALYIRGVSPACALPVSPGDRVRFVARYQVARGEELDWFEVEGDVEADWAGLRPGDTGSAALVIEQARRIYGETGEPLELYGFAARTEVALEVTALR